MADLRMEENELAESASRLWWLYLITGILWLWVTLIILNLNTESVTAIAILFGFVAIGAGINEFLRMATATTGWKIVHAGLGVLFVAAGIVAFFRPQGTFVALAAIVGWVVTIAFLVLSRLVAADTPMLLCLAMAAIAAIFALYLFCT